LRGAADDDAEKDPRRDAGSIRCGR
jgi:hypothetical protein